MTWIEVGVGDSISSAIQFSLWRFESIRPLPIFDRRGGVLLVGSARAFIGTHNSIRLVTLAGLALGTEFCRFVEKLRTG